ncbi:MAG: dihydrofolate reductase [Planctomycetes bacterium]|nr:dihydrofolate reductase [Planctomycetota bacterium]
MPRITLIVAAARNGVIGRDGGLPWHLPEDLKHFKRETLGKPIIMGRKTHESVGMALPRRVNIVLTRRTDWTPAEGCVVAHSTDQALQLAGDVEEVMVVGGAGVYAAFLERADCIHLTIIEADVDGDTRFPTPEPAEWHVVSERVHPADDRHVHALRFQVLERRPCETDL